MRAGVQTKFILAIVHPKMNTGKEFPSAFIRLPGTLSPANFHPSLHDCQTLLVPVIHLPRKLSLFVYLQASLEGKMVFLRFLRQKQPLSNLGQTLAFQGK